MKRALLAAILASSLLTSIAWPGLASAKAADTYQVTGEVVEVNTDVIVVMKGKERFEINRDPADKTDIKVGDKITVHYKMTETSVDKKDDKGKAPAKAPAKKGG
jgi:hypothetical protein